MPIGLMRPNALRFLFSTLNVGFQGRRTKAWMTDMGRQPTCGNVRYVAGRMLCERTDGRPPQPRRPDRGPRRLHGISFR